MTTFRKSKRRLTHYNTVAVGEDEFQTAIIQLAEATGHRVYHVKKVKGQLRNHTAVGFQDLVIAGHGRIIFAENKTDEGIVTADQWAWHKVIAECECPQVRAEIWRPRSWEKIEYLLK